MLSFWVLMGISRFLNWFIKIDRYRTDSQKLIIFYWSLKPYISLIVSHNTSHHIKTSVIYSMYCVYTQYIVLHLCVMCFSLCYMYNEVVTEVCVFSTVWKESFISSLFALREINKESTWSLEFREQFSQEKSKL